MTTRRQIPRLDDKTPLWFKIWFAIHTIGALALLGFSAWVVYTLVTWITSR